MAPHGFGKPLPYPVSVLGRKRCFRSLQRLFILRLLQINRNLLMQRMIHAFFLNKRQESRRFFPLGQAVGQGLGDQQIGWGQLFAVREAFVEILKHSQGRFELATVIQGPGAAH